jgi:CRP/FNR family transcriptional regulator
MLLTSADVPALLRQHFPQLTEPQLQEEIAEVGRIMEFPAGEMMMDYGSYIKFIPLLLKGSIKVSREAEDGSELFLYFLTAGESCTMSFSCCMADKKSAIRTVAEENTTILAIPSRYLDEWMMRYRSWKNFVMQAYDARLLELVETVDQIAFKQLDERLVEYLEKRAAVRESRELSTTHQEIADDLHVSREAVSRLLKTLEKQGRVALGRNRVRLI